MGEPLKSAIYAIVNVADGKVYVGSSVDVERRFRQHRSNLSIGNHWNRLLQDAVVAHGLQGFRFDILEYVSVVELIPAEQRWLDRTRAADRAYGYNLNPSSLRGHFSAEVIARRAETQRARKMPPHVMEALRKANIGSKRTSEQRASQSARQRGAKRPADTGAAISAALKRYQKTDTHLEHMRASLRSPESRAKARAAKLKFHDGIRAAVRADYARGVTKTGLARQYGMDFGTVARILCEISPDLSSTT